MVATLQYRDWQSLRFTIYYLHVITKRLTEVTLHACVVTKSRHPSVVGAYCSIHRMDCTGEHSARCQRGTLPPGLLKLHVFSLAVTVMHLLMVCPTWNTDLGHMLEKGGGFAVRVRIVTSKDPYLPVAHCPQQGDM